jgi:hypothetical protein
MAVVTADYECFIADIGTDGRVSDGGVIQNTEFYTLLQESKLNIPQETEFPNSKKIAPHVFVGDVAKLHETLLAI